jgi:hypothetical protein
MWSRGRCWRLGSIKGPDVCVTNTGGCVLEQGITCTGDVRKDCCPCKFKFFFRDRLLNSGSGGGMSSGGWGRWVGRGW